MPLPGDEGGSFSPETCRRTIDLPEKRETVNPNDTFEEGYDAHWDGVNVTDSPYKEDTDDHRSWEAGRRAARKHDYDESEGGS